MYTYICIYTYKVTVDTNLHRLIYNVLIKIVFPLCFDIS